MAKDYWHGGIASWEYTDCTEIISDELCGCIDNNSCNAYYKKYGSSCC